MEQQVVAFAALCVAGEFAALDRQVCVAFDGDGLGEQVGQKLAVLLHDPCVGSRDGCQRTGFWDAQHEPVIPASRPLKDRAAAAASTQDRNSVVLTGFGLGFHGGLLAVSQNNKRGGGLPKPEGFTSFAGFRAIQKGFVPSQRLGRGLRARGLEPFHDGLRS